VKHLDMILTEIQNLEEICGPETLQEYIAILEAVKADIETRLSNAKTILEGGDG
jgi:hypothetical protein